MKILYINEDRHDGILRAVSNPNNENVYILPKHVSGINGKVYIANSFSKLYSNGKISRYNPRYRRKLAKEILRISEIEKPDVIHFVSSDEYLKLAGFTLGLLHNYKIVITLHWCQNNVIYNILRWILSKKVSYIIFHSINSPIYREKNGEQKSMYLTLPSELTGKIYTQEVAKRNLGIDTELPIISMLGTIEKYKGCDLLLDAIGKIKNKFYLIIAGKPKSISADRIKKAVNCLNDNVLLNLEYISDERFTQIICASNYVVVPYRNSFDATSGPLTESIRCGVPVISTDYGNLGRLTECYKLGYTFKSEDSDSLANTISKAIENGFEITEDFENYRNRLRTDSYRLQQQLVYETVCKR